MSNDRTIRFGLRRGDQRSGTYLVTGSPKTDDVYIMSRSVGVQFKVSLHESGSWRLSVEPIDPRTGEPGEPVGGETWERPPPYAPGLTRVFSVVIPEGAICTPIGPDMDARVRLLEVPPGTRGVEFAVIYASPEVRSTGWPGANALRTTLVGTFTLPKSGEQVYVVARAMETLPGIEPQTATPRLLPGFEREDVERAGREGTLRGILLLSEADGTRWFMDMRGVKDVPPGPQG
jgi:hypothetical protein